jgi:hypothetical protein
VANTLAVVDTGSLSVLTAETAADYSLPGRANWSGNAITSFAAASDSSHLLGLGVVQNNAAAGRHLFGSGTAQGLFDGQDVSLSDVLIKYTVFGDANLNGKADGSDYSLIDSGFNG